MVLRSPWMILIWIVAFIVLQRIYAVRKKKKQIKKPVANTAYMQELETYKRALGKYTFYVRAIAAIMAIIIFLLVVLSLRPAAKTTEQPEFNNRDIILCLDVSGSMTDTDAKVVETFANLTKGFKGERIGMVIFDSSAVTLFPLTDDYEYINDILNKTKASFESKSYNANEYDIYTGVNEGEGSSLIGDGLASCVLRFDNLGTKRSRSIILATDNYANGPQIVDLWEAGGLAKKNDIRVYGLNPNDYSSANYKEKNSTEFREVVLNTEGDYYKFDDPNAVSSIIEKVSKQEAARFKGSLVSVISDKPQIPIIIISLLTIGLFVLFWRLGI